MKQIEAPNTLKEIVSKSVWQRWGCCLQGLGLENSCLWFQVLQYSLIEGQSWTIGVVLLITVGVVLISYVFALFGSHLPTRNVHVTREPAIAKQCSMSPRVMQDDDLDR